MDAHKPILTAIVLQGGGGMGAYEVGVLKALYKERGPDFKPTVLTGISSAGANAAILAGSDIQKLEEVWLRHFTVRSVESLLPFGERFYRAVLPPPMQDGMAALGNLAGSGLFRMRPEVFYQGLLALWTIDSVGDPSPLRKTLDFIDWAKVNLGDTRVVLTAVNATTGQPAYFGNTRSIEDYKQQGLAHPFANKEKLTIEHILASGAIVPGFPPHQVDDCWYLDGGFYLSTPFSEAINALEHCVADAGVEREVIVVDVFALAGLPPQNMIEDIRRSMYILMGNKVELDQKLFQKKNAEIGFVRDVQRLSEMIADLERKVEARGIVVEEPAPELIDDLTVLKEFMARMMEKDSGYKELSEHKQIDYFTRIPFTGGERLANGTDFSTSMIEARIDAGYQEALAQGIKEPRPVPRADLPPAEVAQIRALAASRTLRAANGRRPVRT